METSKTRIFESYPLLSELMPYYGSSPEGFLLLSLLSKSVREYLLEHYPKYRRFMLKYAQKIKYSIYKLSEMKLPLDLFQISALNVCYKEAAEILVGLTRTLSNLNYLANRVYNFIL